MFWFGTLPWQEQRMFGNAPEFGEFAKIADPVARERAFSLAARERIFADIPGYLQLCVKKAVFFIFKPIGDKLLSQRSQILGWGLKLAQGLLILLGISGIVGSRSRWKVLLPLNLILLYYLLLHTILAPEPRYRLPIEPLMIIYAVYFLKEKFIRA